MKKSAFCPPVLLFYKKWQKIKAVHPLETLAFRVAGVVGFEPTQAVLETDVLPLTLYP